MGRTWDECEDCGETTSDGECLCADAMRLLRKFADGHGGKRTGLLKKLGYLEWTVTKAGEDALERLDEHERGFDGW